MAFGQENNTKVDNPAGTYRDPESGASLTVTMAAGADALVRMGWKLVKEGDTATTAATPPETKPEPVFPAKSN